MRILRKALATWAGDDGIMPRVVDYILHHPARTKTGQHYSFSTMESAREAGSAGLAGFRRDRGNGPRGPGDAPLSVILPGKALGSGARVCLSAAN